MVKALFILNLLPSLIIAVMLIMAYFSNIRGTNKVTRFVRDVRSNAIYNMYIMYAVAVTTISILIGLVFSCVYTCIPSVLVIGLAFYLKYLSIKNKQRIEDSRSVTKTSGKVVAATAVPVAATACAATGVGVVAAAGIVAATKGASRVINKSVDQMTDVNSPEVTEEDFKELNNFASKYSSIDFKNPEKFIEAANRAGISTDGVDLATIASKVIQNAPKSMLDILPESMSIEDKAMAIMGGVVDAEYKEIN